MSVLYLDLQQTVWEIDWRRLTRLREDQGKRVLPVVLKKIERKAINAVLPQDRRKAAGALIKSPQVGDLKRCGLEEGFQRLVEALSVLRELVPKLSGGT
jgi:hypothetical protein